MPGTVLDVRVKEGDKIKKGSPIIILSAMKMEMVVQAPYDGTVTSIHVKKDMKLQGEDLVVKMKPL